MPGGPWLSGGTFTLVMVGGGTVSGIFVYDPVIAAGNLIASVTDATADPFGQAVKPGIYQVNAAHTLAIQIFNGLIEFFNLSSVPNLIPNAQAAGGAGGSGLQLSSGQGTGAMAQAIATLQDSGLSLFASPTWTVNGLVACLGLRVGQSSALLAAITTDGGGYPAWTDNGGLALQASGAQLANTSTGQITTVGNHILGNTVSVPSADTPNGARYEWVADGVFTTGAAAPSSATFTLFIGSTAVATLAVPTLNINLTALGWHVRARIVVAAGGTTNSATVDAFLEVGWHTASGVAGSAAWFVAGVQTAAIDMSVARNWTLQFAWGTVPVSTNLNPGIVDFARVA